MQYLVSPKEAALLCVRNNRKSAVKMKCQNLQGEGDITAVLCVSALEIRGEREPASLLSSATTDLLVI
jgi:hypothetical protein